MKVVQHLEETAMLEKTFLDISRLQYQSVLRRMAETGSKVLKEMAEKGLCLHEVKSSWFGTSLLSFIL